VIVIAGTPQEAACAGGDDHQPPCGAFLLARVCCGQTAGWIKMPVDAEVGLVQGDIVIDGTQLTPKKGAQPPPQFLTHVCCDQTSGWIKMALSTEVGLGPGDIVLVGDRAPPRQIGALQPAPTFRPMSIVAERSCISATAELLFIDVIV